MRSGLYGRVRQISYTPPPPVAAPGQVTGLAAGAPGETSVPLSWAQPAGTAPLTYRVEFKRTADATWSVSTAANTPLSYTVTGLLAGTAYQFRVRAENVAGLGEYSTVLAVSTSAPAVVAPGAPVNLRTLSGGTVNQINAAWDQGTGGAPDSYEVWHRAGNTGSFTLRGSTASTSYLFSISPSVINHYVYVVARNAAGTAQSATMQVTIA